MCSEEGVCCKEAVGRELDLEGIEMGKCIEVRGGGGGVGIGQVTFARGWRRRGSWRMCEGSCRREGH